MADSPKVLRFSIDINSSVPGFLGLGVILVGSRRWCENLSRGADARERVVVVVVEEWRLVASEDESWLVKRLKRSGVLWKERKRGNRFANGAKMPWGWAVSCLSAPRDVCESPGDQPRH